MQKRKCRSCHMGLSLWLMCAIKFTSAGTLTSASRDEPLLLPGKVNKNDVHLCIPPLSVATRETNSSLKNVLGPCRLWLCQRGREGVPPPDAIVMLKAFTPWLPLLALHPPGGTPTFQLNQTKGGSSHESDESTPPSS